MPYNTTKDTKITAYSDADFANDDQTRKSFSGTIVTLNDFTVYWQAKQQPIVAKSTCEAEYIAAAETATHAIWLRNTLTEIGIYTTELPLCIDNTAAEHIARQKAPTKRRKCIDIRYHYSQDVTQNQTVAVQRIGSKDMPADIMTKPVKAPLYHKHRQHLGVIMRPPPTAAS
ncbi:unnamed protein product [Chondrus crispus]|uniref:Reverse transcriptase Ty1/copia-type domain-containing protein n=1 Tax=Chondrus crispus TaxID=2769 RepID=R7Q745_CHOCR|nr:unnamed protein product [Chondrus crispus]CDF33643.1 unnamed protein product [Chondrus crispus]|eukprot:XP_005713462.1 unnamed protein product [Chondrus crispus]